MEVLQPGELLTEESKGSKPSKSSKVSYCFFLFQIKFIVPMSASSNCGRPFISVADKLSMRHQPRQLGTASADHG